MIKIETDTNEARIFGVRLWARRSSFCFVLFIQVIILPLNSGFTSTENLAITEGNSLCAPTIISYHPR